MKKKPIRRYVYPKLHQILRCMKLSVLFVVLFTFQLSASVYSQKTKLDVKASNESFLQVIKQIRAQSEFTFIYEMKDVENLTKLNIRVKNKTVESILDKCMENTNLTYKIVNNVIIIKQKSVLEQEKKTTLVGHVLDIKGNPLPGVTIVLKGTIMGTSTNVNGEFKLSLPESKIKNGILIVSFVGMETQEIAIKNFRDFKIVLKEDTKEIEEVVVTGIFDKPRESFTGAVTTIRKEEIKMYRGQNLIRTLQNIDPSLNIAQDNLSGSDPNHLPNMTIRGNSSLPMSVNELNSDAAAKLNAPLIIMDGFEISLTKLMDFNDEEIESINIMKDASATAIYGSRGANGVIVITTKKPEAGVIKFYVQTSLNLEIPDLSSYDLLNAKEKLNLEKTVGLYSSDSPTEQLKYEEGYNLLLKNIENGVDTDWLNIPTRTGVGSRINVRLEGGSDIFKWSASFDNNAIIGVMKGSDRKISTGAINLQYQLKKFQISNRSEYSVTNSSESKYGSFSRYVNMNPYWRLEDEDGNYYQYYNTYGKRGAEYDNPLYNSRLNVFNDTRNQTLLNNLSFMFDSRKGFRWNTRFGISRTESTTDNFLPPSHTYFRTYDVQGKSRSKGRYNYSN
ncbi:MAG: carboxypeptidase-like regulatory domain-containing protein, partial [Bacteroides sp.]|nr:carboxypeptidase-like regulatory domain-containing protein [Bacteroides sp.]